MADVVMEDASSKGKEVKVKVEEGSGGAAKKKRLEIKKWNAVTLWSWDIVVDNCAICRNHIMDLCESTESSRRNGNRLPIFPSSSFSTDTNNKLNFATRSFFRSITNERNVLSSSQVSSAKRTSRARRARSAL